jgi:hypothetical protein
MHLNEMAEIVFTFIPQHILLAKLIRPGTESTMMGISYSLLLLNASVLRDIGGALINESFIGVSKDDLSNYWICLIISTLVTLIPMTYIYWLVPTNEECEQVERKHKIQFDPKS